MNEDLSHNLPLPAFDRELNFKELMGGIDESKLIDSLSLLLATDVQISSRDGRFVIGKLPEPPVKKIPLRPEMEAVAYLQVNASVDDEKIHAGRIQLEILLKSSARYLMASDLHLHAIQDDFDKLEKEHQALIESEARYRELSVNLEERVAEQVKTIDAAQRQLYQSEKMASVGQLAAGVAHEINNPIGFINSNLNTAKSYVNDLQKLADIINDADTVEQVKTVMQEININFILEDFIQMMNESIDGAARVTKIVKDLKDFSNIDHNEEELADINDVIKSVCNVANSEIIQTAALTIDAGDIPKTICRPGFLGQVFVNVLLNAAKAVDEDGHIHISSGLENGKITVRISDNGCGIPEELIDRIFDPFFTTNEVGDGTGLGLTVSRDIILSHQGEFLVESQPDKGTTFIIQLPIISTKSELQSNS